MVNITVEIIFLLLLLFCSLFISGIISNHSACVASVDGGLVEVQIILKNIPLKKTIIHVPLLHLLWK
jgi:hypothetical protein